MAKGYLFYVTTDPEEEICFKASNYYERLDALNADNVRDLSTAESKPGLDSLETLFTSHGGICRKNWDRNLAFDVWFTEAALADAKIRHFAPKLERLKAHAAELTLQGIIEKAPELDWIANNTAGDMVALNDGETVRELTIDDFIRELKPNTKYYACEHAILMR